MTPVYDPARLSPDGGPALAGWRGDIRCGGTGVVEKPEAFVSTYEQVIQDAGYWPTWEDVPTPYDPPKPPPKNEVVVKVGA